MLQRNSVQRHAGSGSGSFWAGVHEVPTHHMLTQQSTQQTSFHPHALPTARHTSAGHPAVIARLVATPALGLRWASSAPMPLASIPFEGASSGEFVGGCFGFGVAGRAPDAPGNQRSGGPEGRRFSHSDFPNQAVDVAGSPELPTAAGERRLQRTYGRRVGNANQPRRLPRLHGGLGGTLQYKPSSFKTSQRQRCRQAHPFLAGATLGRP